MRTAAVKRPRVALVAASLEILGGQGVQAQALVSGLANDGYTVRFIPINPRFPSGLRWLRALPYARTALNQALYLPSLGRVGAADVVHVFSASYWSFLLAPAPAMLAGRTLRARVVLHYHSGEAGDHLGRWGALVHPWLKLAHDVVVPSPYLRDVFAQHGYRARVIPNVVDTSRFVFRNRPRPAPRLLSTRNLEPHYRVGDVIEAFARVVERRPEATLTIAGYGSEEARLRRQAAPLGSSVRFVGRVEPPAMPALCDAADVFVNASVVDNQPISLLEAFAAGLPVVSTATGDIPSMAAGGDAALLVPQRDAAALAAAIDRILDEPGLAVRLTARARDEVRRYSWREVSAQWAAVYSGAAA